MRECWATEHYLYFAVILITRLFHGCYFNCIALLGYNILDSYMDTLCHNKWITDVSLIDWSHTWLNIVFLITGIRRQTVHANLHYKLGRTKQLSSFTYLHSQVWSSCHNGWACLQVQLWLAPSLSYCWYRCTRHYCNKKNNSAWLICLNEGYELFVVS